MFEGDSPSGNSPSRVQMKKNQSESFGFFVLRVLSNSFEQILEEQKSCMEYRFLQSQDVRAGQTDEGGNSHHRKFHSISYLLFQGDEN